MQLITVLRISKYALLLCLLLHVQYLKAQRPNIIYIMTDDMGYGDLSCYGNKKFSTPNLDKLASQGVKFVNAYAAAPVCTPTRTALFTGRYPAKTSLGLLEPLRSPKKDSAYGLTPNIPSIGLLMKASGYETALIGKWHLGFMPHQSPNKNGFDYFYGIHSGGIDYISHKGENGNRAHDFYENDLLIYPQGYATDLFSQQSISFIKQKHKKPFFLMLTYNAPHWPWQGPTDLPYPDSVNFSAGGSPEIYAAMMKSLDDGIGQIMQALDETQLNKNTLVIFTNDNGGEKYSDNGGLTKAKFTLWEGGIRVPAFVRWPGKIGAGITTTQVATTMDWTTTMLKVAKAKPNKQFPLDGIDLMPVLKAKVSNIDRTLYWRVFQRNKQKAVRDGKWKYLKDEKGEYLFDLSIDQEEKNDVKDKETKIFNALKVKLAEWEKTLLTPIPL
jgi:arylsulfatase A-like enzyme